jgi:hypothetical protein
MIKHTFEDISSGGGFNHYWITFPKYSIGVLINKADSGALPKEGDRFDIGVYKLEYESNCDKSPSMGEHFENSFNTLDNFGHAQIVARALGYAEALGLAKEKKTYKKFLCIWNEGSDSEIFEVHDFASLWDNYKRTNLYEDEFAENYGSCIEAILDSLEIDEKVTFDNMEVTRIR